jgi:hypothetical protein
MTDLRRARAEMLARELNIDPDGLPAVLDRYAATATQASDPDANGYLQTFPAFPDACAELGNGVLEGYLPAGVYDLDTGELIVTRSEDQGISHNPLEAVLRCPDGHTWTAAILEDREGAVTVAKNRAAFCPECELLGEVV